MFFFLLIGAFILGFGIGALIFIGKNKKAPIDIETSLKNALIIPAAKPAATPNKPTETDVAQKMRADTLEKKILYEEELSLMFQMGREMFSSISYESIVKTMAESANKIINAEICTVLLEDRSSGELFPVHTQGIEQDKIRGLRLKKGEGISGWVAQSKEVLVIDDLNSDPWFSKQNKGEYFLNTLVSIPLATKDRVIGILNLSNKKSRQPFTKEEIEFLKGLSQEASIALQNASLYEQIQESYLRTITALAFALDARDSYTREHSENVTRYAVAIAQEINLVPTDVERIRRAGLLHDIGKIGIRDGVLLKPTKLTDDEYNDIKNHPAKGEAIVNALPFLKEESGMIRHHHERFDGKGYPDGLSGENIEIGARILAVADSFDAMVQNRIYRKALDMNIACEELKKNRGKQFDPEIVDALLRALGKNPSLLPSGNQNPA